ncbi:Metallo-dependent phosphatase-like protein [Lactarius akahatsu]|uniref:Metallo-dependent phosphatase-like protein n=1 Tax=Lactarius akahatsu TaxID=416441 RepID=A0AAD4QCZ1_9AGAM|nr:Metallo-dependent phosphatase-like protein [Lactarius akahatsu]
MKALAPLLVSLVLSAVARQDGGNEHRFQVPLASPLAIQAQPYRELVWGDVNIIHTTDIHGWLLGHQKTQPPEPNYKGTLGDLASFVSRMNTTAQNKGYDFLLVDTGDLRDGTGLSDGHPKEQWAGEETDKFFLRLPYDVMTIGNHELYNPPTIAYDMHANFSKKTKRYLTSNAFININGDKVPIGWQFAKFKTPSVQPAEIMVNQPWFLDAIKERPSFFLLTGHMSVGERFNDWRAVVKPIRDLHKDTPIIILAGHTHTRNCTQFNDDKVVAIESGAFMDTVGFNLSNTDKPLDYSRRYLDPNRVTYKYHTHAQKDEDFDTDEGKNITKDLWKLYDDFHLSRVWGSSPKDYTLFRVSNNSVLDLFVGEALPEVLKNATCKGSKQRQKFSFMDSGVLRYDIYEGKFDQNDQLTASPYADPLWQEDLTLGYVTTDQCGTKQAGDGDDVKHNPIHFLNRLPKIVTGPSTVNATLVDLVIIDRGWRNVLGNLSVSGRIYTENDIDKNFTKFTTNEVLGEYALHKWN